MLRFWKVLHCQIKMVRCTAPGLIEHENDDINGCADLQSIELPRRGWCGASGDHGSKKSSLSDQAKSSMHFLARFLEIRRRTYFSEFMDTLKANAEQQVVISFWIYEYTWNQGWEDLDSHLCNYPRVFLDFAAPPSLQLPWSSRPSVNTNLLF